MGEGNEKKQGRDRGEERRKRVHVDNNFWHVEGLHISNIIK